MEPDVLQRTSIVPHYHCCAAWPFAQCESEIPLRRICSTAAVKGREDITGDWWEASPTLLAEVEHRCIPNEAF